ncbi:hypothetical protein [Actinomadura violacea]|uniref:Uncharacterized protein n=1 Tax=Actinomadura violacea TaxID=2819934 RepID=A0ABS3RP38_9ACTN|nr:hypothetical protein [Actinomadura violacea]MBO2458313.1 hypothetical protein [Actinomadura violacea]
MRPVFEHTTPPLVRLPLSGITVHTAKGVRGRPAFEVYAGPLLADISVVSSIGGPLVRGAWRGRPPGGRDQWAVAWGQLPAGCSDVDIVFSSAEDGTATSGQKIIIGDVFWVAELGGTHRTVTATCGDGCERIRLRRFRYGTGRNRADVC